jgi:hypothetical protein
MFSMAKKKTAGKQEGVLVTAARTIGKAAGRLASVVGSISKAKATPSDEASKRPRRTVKKGSTPKRKSGTSLPKRKKKVGRKTG